jgi:hypothetical protein
MPAIFTFAALLIGIIFFGKVGVSKNSVSPTPTPSITMTPTVSVTLTATPKPSVTRTPTPTRKSTVTATPTKTLVPSATPKPTEKIFYASPTQTTAPVVQTSGGYACDCSKTCPNMSSCAEAQYQLNICGCSARDGDHDGLACDADCQ